MGSSTKELSGSFLNSHPPGLCSLHSDLNFRAQNEVQYFIQIQMNCATLWQPLRMWQACNPSESGECGRSLQTKSWLPQGKDILKSLFSGKLSRVKEHMKT